MFDVVLNRSKHLLKHYRPAVRKKSVFSETSVSIPLPQLKSLETSNRVRKKIVFPKHFIENLFLKKVKETILEYPQLGSLKELKSITERGQYASKLLAAYSSTEGRALSEVQQENVINHIKDLGLSGFKSSVEKGGFGYLNCEYAFLQEALYRDLSLSKTISENENFGVEVINSFGNESQKQKYIERLSNGENMACFAHLEADNLTPLEPCSLSTKAVLQPDGCSYLLSGTKNWVYNASQSDIIIVSCYIVSKPEDKDLQKKITLFIVDKNLTGITIHEPFKTIGLEGVKISPVTFDQVLITNDCVLGAIDEGDMPLKYIFTTRELSNSAHSIPIMKKLLDLAMNHCTHKKRFKKYKCDTDYFKLKIGNIVSRIYNVESMTYLVAGRMDSLYEPDLFLESLILKIYSSETLQFVLKETLEIIGMDLFSNEMSSLEELIKDCQFFSASDYNNTYLKTILSMTCFKYYINHEKCMNPLLRMISLMKYWHFRMTYGSLTKYSLYGTQILKGYVHPVYEKESKALEDMIFRLHACSEFLYKKYGENMLNRKTELIMIADLVVIIYSIIASLGRASRAYCLGFRNLQTERRILECETRRCHYHFVEIDSLIRNSSFCETFQKVSPEKSSKGKHPILVEIES